MQYEMFMNPAKQDFFKNSEKLKLPANSGGLSH